MREVSEIPFEEGWKRSRITESRKEPNTDVVRVETEVVVVHGQRRHTDTVKDEDIIATR